MPEVLPIRRDMLPELCAGILRELNPKMPPQAWERAFTAGDPDQPSGYVLTDSGSFVGLLGMIFSCRNIGGREERFCNLHSWYVRPDYRVHSLALMRKLAALRDVTITDFSATPQVRAISRRMGFADLDRTAVALPPLAWASDIEKCGLMDLDDAGSTATFTLNSAEQAIHRDHRALSCHELLVYDSCGYCYIVYSRITHGVLPRVLASSLVHHVSDPVRFVRHHAAIRAHLMQRTCSQCVVVDSRLLAGESIPSSVRMPAIPKIYRSARLRPEQIDGLYSEQVCFKLSTLPTLRTLLTHAVRTGTPQFVRRAVPAEY